MTEDEYRAIQRRGQAAKAMLDNEDFQSVMEAVTEDAIATWMNADAADVATREDTHAEIRAAKAIRLKLKTWVDDAQFEAATLEKKQRR